MACTEDHLVGPAGKLSLPEGTIYLRTTEAARYCRCGKRRLENWERRGIIRSVTDADGRRFYLLAELDSAMVGGPVARSSSAPVSTRRPRRLELDVELPDLPFTLPRTVARR